MFKISFNPMFDVMYTLYLKSWLHHIWSHIYTIFGFISTLSLWLFDPYLTMLSHVCIILEVMFSPCFKLCLHSVWNHVYTMLEGGGQFDTTFSEISRTFKRVHVQFWNFLTFPKFQKQKFWKNMNYRFFTPNALRGGY